MTRCSLAQTIADIHILAYCYHWNEMDIWDMPRERRRLWSELVQAQKQAESPDYKPNSHIDGADKYSPSYKESM